MSLIVMNAKKGQVSGDREDRPLKAMEPVIALFPWCEHVCPECGRVCELKVEHKGEHECLDRHSW